MAAVPRGQYHHAVAGGSVAVVVNQPKFPSRTHPLPRGGTDLLGPPVVLGQARSECITTLRLKSFDFFRESQYGSVDLSNGWISRGSGPRKLATSSQSRQLSVECYSFAIAS